MPSGTDHHELITRREAILRVSALLGGVALVGQGAMLSGCVRRMPGGTGFTEADVALLDEIAETILPETSTPGAKAAGTGQFIALMVNDTYDAREQQVFRDGLQTLDDECRKMHGASFMPATSAQRLALLESLDAEQMQYMHGRSDDAPAHYFRMLKELTLLGYFTSEIGYNQAMRYVESPGRFDPCTPYAPGEKSWASHV
ncbi:MAG: gluconate 2-dehydrogenase subunit 3 family protein [Woeseia sp.]